MTNDNELDRMLKTLIEKRDKLAYTIVKCHDEGYSINDRKANLFYLLNIVSECYLIVDCLTTVQKNKLMNLSKKLLIL